MAKRHALSRVHRISSKEEFVRKKNKNKFLKRNKKRKVLKRNKNNKGRKRKRRNIIHQMMNQMMNRAQVGCDIVIEN